MLNMNEIKSHWKKWVYWFLFAVAVIVVYKALDNFSDVMGAIGTFFEVITPFLAGIFIAYLLYLPCKIFEQKFRKSKLKFIHKKARVLGVVSVYIIAILVIALLIMFILPIILDSVVDLINNIPGYYETAVDQLNHLPQDSFWNNDIINQIIESIKQLDLKQFLQFDKIISYVSGAISAVFSIVDVFIALIVSIYILVDRTSIMQFLRKLATAIFPQKTYNHLGKYFDDSNTIFFKFIASQFIDAVIVGILVSIALTIMGVRYSIVLGFFIGLFNMIPYFGAIIATALSAIITIITGGLSQAIWMLIVVIILQQIDANIINPKIVGKSLKINPLLVIFSVTVGGAFFGMLGMFLAVPVIAVVKILVEDYIEYKINSRNLKNNDDIINDDSKNEKKVIDVR